MALKTTVIHTFGFGGADQNVTLGSASEALSSGGETFGIISLLFNHPDKWFYFLTKQ